MSEIGVKLSAVIDTNLFISGAISLTGAPHLLLRAWTSQRFDLIVSNQQYEELIEVFRRPRLIAKFTISANDVATLLARLAVVSRVQPSATIPFPLRDAKDEKILAAAIGGNADYLVTGDAELLVHRQDRRVQPLRIVTVNEFLPLLG